MFFVSQANPLVDSTWPDNKILVDMLLKAISVAVSPISHVQSLERLSTSHYR